MMTPRQQQELVAVGLELVGSAALASVAAVYLPHGGLWAPPAYLVYLAFAYRRWMKL